MCTGDCHCGCCEGARPLPEARHNATGAPAIVYRIGTHATFKAALLARLSSTSYPALGRLRTRRDDDFTVAACDAAATLLDVITFYQERYANERFLRTATERRAIVELSRLIGYQPSPGVAAGTRLAFVLEDAPGAPALAAEPVTVAAGTRVQSVPGPGETPQTFETVAEVTARVEWNAIPVQAAETQTFVTGTREIFLSGVSVQVQAGDVVLVVGDERKKDVTKKNWDARIVDAVERLTDSGVTRLTLASGLGQVSPAVAPAALNPRVYVLRQRCGLFGHSAPDPNLMSAPSGMTEGTSPNLTWKGYKIDSVLDLDNSYPKVLAGGWLLLAGGEGATGLPSLPGLVELYGVKEVRHRSRTAFGSSGRITRVTPDTTTNLSQFKLDAALVIAQSEELPLAQRRLAYPLYGTELALSRVVSGLAPQQEIAISGRRQRLRVIVDEATLAFVPDGGAAVPIKPNDSFRLAAPPATLVSGSEVAIAPADFGALVKAAGSGSLLLRVIDRDDLEGTLQVPAYAVELESARAEDLVINELAIIDAGDAAIVQDRDRTTVQLASPLEHVYDRSGTTVCANVAPATHGEAVSEIAGSGNAAIVSQRFTLRQAPLTYVSAATADGRQSSLEVWVDGLLWSEVPTLFEQPSDARVYALRQDGDGNTIVQFGDGFEGARLPTGVDNVRFSYRKFLGSGGNLAAGRLTTLLGRPLGVKSTTNVMAAAGGEDAELLADARVNAPLTMLTLGRAVSLQDYTDFARSFAGIAKARATWLGAGAARCIHVTVAGPSAAAIDQASDTMVNLLQALREYGDPLVPLAAQSFAAVTFQLEARIKVAADADADSVLPDVETALREHFHFDTRDFGQTVSLDEVMAVMQAVTGVEGVDVDLLCRSDAPTPVLEPRLFAYPATLEPDGTAAPAELLTLDPGPLALEVMP